MFRYRAAAAILAACLVPVTAQAQSVSAQDPKPVVAAIQRAGLTAELKASNAGDPMISSGMDGWAFTVFFYNCTNHINCETIQFFAGFPNAGASLEKLNAWNNDHRFGRAYLSDRGSSRIEMDVDLAKGGVSDALFQDNILYWAATLNAFKTYIGIASK